MNEDERRIQWVINGDTEAFRPLVERYQSPILRFIANIVGDRQLAEDIGQEVFLAAFRNLASFAPDRSRFSTWLFTIARNKTLATIKKKQVACLSELPEQAAPGPSGSEMENAELHRALDRALASLPDTQRTAFVLAEFEEMTYEEIAQIEGTRLGTIRSRISRAREKLQQILHQYGEAT